MPAYRNSAPFIIWCITFIVCLPFFYVAQINLLGTFVGPTELLVSILLVTAGAFTLQNLFSGHSVKVKKFEIRSVSLLAGWLILQFYIAYYRHGFVLVHVIKIVLGQVFVFVIVCAFARVSPHESKRLMRILVWISSVVVVISIIQGISTNLRLDSQLWGRSNAFAAALVIPSLLGFSILSTKETVRYLFP